MPSAAQLEGVWYEEDTTPSAIDAALRNLLVTSYKEDRPLAPARVLNMVVIVDRHYKGEIANRLERVGRYHPSRTILIGVEEGRTTLEAWAQVSCEIAEGGLAVATEQVEIAVGRRHLAGLDAIVDPLIVSDLTTLVWAPHGHEDGVDALRRLFQVVLLDSAQQLDPGSAVKRAVDLASDAYVVDLAWLRSTPWRERIAATFDPPLWRPALKEISAVTVHAREDSVVAGLLLLGWLSCRLGWRSSALMGRDGAYIGSAHAKRHDVKIRLESASDLSVPGLAGVQIETASGMTLSLDRGPGGLHAKRRLRDGRESHWVVVGASRGEAGILGEGIRQALLRDPVYRPSLDCALTMLGV
jgi:glucose-6-phosphate dehydrogenase assembly protein OpcA